MLRVLRIDNTKDKSTTKKILHVFEVFGSNLDDFFHLVIPAIVNLFNDIEVLHSSICLFYSHSIRFFKLKIGEGRRGANTR